ncbi:flagellin [Bacillus coahuilensis m2-6]|nr:flagellin [Bacillus coahuilensis]KUP05702.1 flagellin [Bacillus coahuilensis m2-6]
MIINHNIAALNTYRQLDSANNAGAKSMEKLSSGLRINRAGDDAAGLAISEKMRGQIRGLDQAQRNSQDGISMIQTAEGALNETHSILQRMRELSVQSANDTQTEDDRSKIQAEVDELAKEVTRISNDTEFNTQNLMAGGLDNTFHIGANQGQSINLKINAMDAKSLGVAGFETTATINSSNVGIEKVEMDRTTGTSMGNGTTQSFTVSDTAAKTQWNGGATGLTGMTIESSANSSKYNDYKFEVKQIGAGATTAASINESSKTITLSLASDHATAVTAVEVNAAFTTAGIGDLTAGSTDSSAGGNSAQAAASASQAGLASDELKFTMNGESVIVKEDATKVAFNSTANKGVTLVKDSAVTTAAGFSGTNSFDVSVSSSSAAVLNADGTVKDKALAAVGLDVSTQSSANEAITKINDAITTVSEERSKLGAYQNRLEHTINNLSTSSENLTAAESRIRDVDMAKEMMNQTKESILAQASQAMLAKANQAPQGVLQLLR